MKRKVSRKKLMLRRRRILFGTVMFLMLICLMSCAGAFKKKRRLITFLISYKTGIRFGALQIVIPTTTLIPELLFIRLRNLMI